MILTKVWLFSSKWSNIEARRLKIFWKQWSESNYFRADPRQRGVWTCVPCLRRAGRAATPTHHHRLWIRSFGFPDSGHLVQCHQSAAFCLLLKPFIGCPAPCCCMQLGRAGTTTRPEILCIRTRNRRHWHQGLSAATSPHQAGYFAPHLRDRSPQYMGLPEFVMESLSVYSFIHVQWAQLSRMHHCFHCPA